jgi:hypothetical protein
MSDRKKLDDDALVTRMFCRKLGLNVTNTTFQRWETKKRVTPVKPGGTPSSHVYYRWGEVRVNLLKEQP